MSVSASAPVTICPKIGFGQAQCGVRRPLQEFLGRQDLAAGDAGHVRHHAFDFAHAPFLQPVANSFGIVAWLITRSPLRVARLGMRAHSLAECAEQGAALRVFPPAAIPDATARRERSLSRRGMETASIVPSGASASTRRPGASRSIGLGVQRIDGEDLFADDSRRACRRLRHARHGRGRISRPSSCARGGVIDAAGLFGDMLEQCAAQRHVQFLHAAADEQGRHAGGERGLIRGRVVASRLGSARLPSRGAGPP